MSSPVVSICGAGRYVTNPASEPDALDIAIKHAKHATRLALIFRGALPGLMVGLGAGLLGWWALSAGALLGPISRGVSVTSGAAVGVVIGIFSITTLVSGVRVAGADSVHLLPYDLGYVGEHNHQLAWDYACARATEEDLYESLWEGKFGENGSAGFTAAQTIIEDAISARKALATVMRNSGGRPPSATEQAALTAAQARVDEVRMTVWIP